jgi:hypothetical protein
MKTNNSTQSRKCLMAIAAVMLFSSITFSCKKDASQVTSPKNNMDDAAAILDGKMLSGNIIGNNSKETLALNFNNGQQYILLEKMPGTDLTVMAGTNSAKLITSAYGVVVNDAVHNQTLLFANNDQESLAKMEAVKSLLNSNSEIFKVFGVTTVNTAN